MIEWPEERRHRLATPVRMSHLLVDIPADLRREVEASGPFTALVGSIVDAFNMGVDSGVQVLDLSRRIQESDEFGKFDGIVREVAPALASVAAFRSVPTREMWEYLWSLAWHSALLEIFLPQAVVVAATDATFRDQFIAVALSVVKAAAQNPGRHAMHREKQIGPTRREQWQKHPQLSLLWRGNFGHSFHAVSRDDDHVLSIVAEIDAAELVRLLAHYDYPDPVIHALIQCGVPSHFERWRAVASAAPAAFGERRQWNGSLVLPLLLSIARDQFQFELGREPTPDQVCEATSDIKNLAAEVARTIAPRADALGCFTRWGNWLVRTAMPEVSANRIPHPTDAASRGFIEDALLEAVIVEMPADGWSQEAAPGAEAWEPWCQLAAGTLIALAGKTSMPSPAAFLDEWCLTPERWQTQPGEKLKLRAVPFVLAGARADGYGARLLALPLVEAERADTAWKLFWDVTFTLREIVEFGDTDDAEGGGWQGRREAAELLMFQFSIGLMMMDHLITLHRQLPYDRLAALEGQLPLLDEAVREMAAIDRLNGKFWSEAIRHLAIRRAKWVSNGAAPSGVTLSTEAKPTLADFIRSLAGDTENLLALVYFAQQNGVQKDVLAAAFRAAEVDIDAEVAIAEHLLAISPRAIGLNEVQINAAREVLLSASSVSALS